MKTAYICDGCSMHNPTSFKYDGEVYQVCEYHWPIVRDIALHPDASPRYREFYLKGPARAAEGYQP